MTTAQFRVDHPKNGMKIDTTRFSAFGDAPPNSLIYGKAIGGHGQVFAGQTVRQPGADGRWTVNFLDIPFVNNESFKLEFTDVGGMIVAEVKNLRLHLSFGAMISWPPNSSDHCNSRVPMYGSLTSPDTAIQQLTLGGLASTWTYFDPSSGYIAAEFGVNNGVYDLVLKGNVSQDTRTGINCHSNFC